MTEAATHTELRAAIDDVLARFVRTKRDELAPLGPEIEPLLAQAEVAMTGGKRLRGGFAYWGFLAVEPPRDADVERALVQACAGLEALHASALVHDDLMDSSDSRRGRPSAHVAFATHHRSSHWGAGSAEYGAAGAILLGDLLQGWAEELVRGCGLPGVVDAMGLFDRCRNEVIAGQFLDVTVQARGHADVDAAMRVLRFKSAKYSIERPLHIGASLTGAATSDQLSQLSHFGLPLGEAFQLRDDLLGVFGDPEVTGKPAGDDLVEGKRTVLVALALDAAPRDEAAALEAGLGTSLSPQQITRLQEIIEGCGAKAQVESVISELLDRALTRLDQATITETAREALRALAVAATHRQR